MADIVDILIEKGVLRPETWDEIRKKSSIEKDRTEEFLLLLLKKPFDYFVIFREALREHGYNHLAEKLDKMDDKNTLEFVRKLRGKGRQVSEKGEADGGNINFSHVMKRIKELEERERLLEERDRQREKEISNNKQELEKKLEKNLAETDKKLEKMRESLLQKESEIEKLMEIQRKQEKTNQDLLDENLKLETEREDMTEKINRQKMKEEKLTRERDKLKRTVERQDTQLEELTKEKLTIMENLRREKSFNENLQRQNTNLTDQISSLEKELTPRSTWALQSVGDINTDRRQPTGISNHETDVSLDDDNTRGSPNIKQAQRELEEVKEQIKAMEEKRIMLRRRLNELSRSQKVVDSGVCIVQ